MNAPMTAFAAALALAAVAAWIAARGIGPRSRLQLRFACVLYATLAAGTVADIAPAAVAQIVTTLATAFLALAAFARFRAPPKPVPAAIALAATCLAGIASAASGVIVLAAVPQLVCVVVMVALARRGLGTLRRAHIYLALGAVALLAATSCLLLDGVAARVALLLFSAAGLLGTAVALASNVLVEDEGERTAWLAIRRLR